MDRRAVLYRVALIFCSFCSTACVSMFFSSPKVKSDSYSLGAPPVPWTKVDPGTADTAYQNESDRATISVNSVCGQYQDMSLEELTKSLMLGLEASKVETVDKLTLDGQPAMRTTTSGKMATANVTVIYTVLRSERCVYDFLLVAHSEDFLKHRQTYIDLVATFREGPKS